MPNYQSAYRNIFYDKMAVLRLTTMFLLFKMANYHQVHNGIEG